MTSLELIVEANRAETPSIRRIVLAPAAGGALPGFDAGAHITLAVPGVGPRKYSLVSSVPSADATVRPAVYELAVRLDATGGGGSRWVHTLEPGDRVVAEPPQNNFPLREGTSPVLLIAGGIGVTPLVTMAAAMRATGRPFHLVYAARTRSEMAYLAEIGALTGDVTLHADDEAGRVLDLDALLAGVSADTNVYMCGPKPMLKAAMDAARRLGWPRERLAFELFYSVATAASPVPAPEIAPAGGGAFEVVLKSSGAVYAVPAERSILDVLIEGGVDALYDCKRGECGVCQVGVIEGEPDHRCSILSEAERAGGKVIQTCVSRSRSPRLVLDL